MKSVIKILVGTGIMIFVLVFLLSSINSSVSSVTNDDSYSPAIKEIVGVLPVVYTVGVVVGTLSLFYVGERVTRLLRWREFGNRLKVAYVAKFGYENIAFNEEVDNHTRIMRTMSNMDTKQSAEDWLKRMAHMVEVKYVIPEEEYLSETEKTKQLNDIKQEEMSKWQKGVTEESYIKTTKEEELY